MRRGVVVGILGGVVLALATAAGAAAAEPTFLTRSELTKQAKQNGELRTYMERNGYPDVAEVRERLDSGQWENETVILYYLDAHKQIAFGMAHMYVEDFGSHRSTQEMTDEEVAALSNVPSMRTPADEALAKIESHDLEATMAAEATSKNPADRAEAAAYRAEQAAAVVEEAAIRTEKAADRTEAVVEKMLAAAKR
jgi:hypothetical protein